MPPGNEQAAFIRSCKGMGESGKSLRIPLRMEDGKEAGSIFPVDPSVANDPGVISDLTRWRSESRENFLTEFEPSEGRTKNWLNQVVVPNHDRLLFLIEAGGPGRVGHFGIADVSPDALELDNGIRGESGGHPRLFVYVELYVMHFAYTCLKVESVHVRVFSDNLGPRRLHRMVGFTESSRKQLIRVKQGEGEYGYLPFESGLEGDGSGMKEQILLTMSRADFYEKHSWLRASKLN